MRGILFIVLLSTFHVVIFAQPGSNDPTFNTFDDGTYGDGTGFDGTVHATSIQEDGKIIVGGGFTSFNGMTINCIARLNIDGSLDTDFDPGIGFNDRVRSVTIQADGKIIVGGYFTSFNGVTTNYIARLNSDGSFDTSFNTGSGFSLYVESLAIQTDGKIVVGGRFSSFGGMTVNHIARLNTDGTIDNSFETGLGFNRRVYSTTLQADGKIIVGGRFTSFNDSTTNRIARLNSNGSLDSTFNTASGFSGTVYSTTIQADGKIIVGGVFTSFDNNSSRRIARLNSDGSLDSDFSIESGFNSTVKVTTIQEDGKIVVGGSFTSFNDSITNCIARLNADGSLDESFNTKSGSNSNINSLSIQQDGKIIVGGFILFNNTISYHIIRLHSDGSLAPYFNIQPGFDKSVVSTAIQSDGKIIVGGDFTSFNNTINNHIVRLNVNGSLDTSFNTGSGFDSEVYSLAIQSDGKIIVGGTFDFFNNKAAFRIARLNTDGSLDSSFITGIWGWGHVESIEIQSDGKILVIGNLTFSETTNHRIVRLNADGSLDNSFNIDSEFDNAINSLAIQPDGKIIVGGVFTSFNGETANRILRLNADGSLDNSFNTGVGFNRPINSLTIQPDGKILVGGRFTSFNDLPARYISRLNIDGSLDDSFKNLSGLDDRVYSITIQSDDKILVGGRFTSFSGTTTSRIARLNSNGTLDTTFDSGTGFSSPVYCSVFSINIQVDGKIIVGGFFTQFDGVWRNHIARLLNCSTTASDVQNACDSYTWIDGNTYTESNNSAIYVLNNSTGCDSIVTLDLTINSNTGTDIQSACDSYTWIDGNIYTESNNSATHVLTNAAGCDSTVTLDLTINSNTGTDIKSVCDSYTWIDGNTYTESNNTATYTLTNVAGCDSVVTLNLTVDNTGNDLINACDSYTWIDGNTYTESNNSATYVITTAEGCDSTVTLDLTVNYNNTGIDVQTACDSLTWIDGVTYTESNNSSTYVLTNSSGCDSTVTLDLSINNSTSGTDTQITCDSLTWIDGNTYTESNNSATHILTNAIGCDSIVTLDLTINSNSGTDTQIACDSLIWIDGNTYTKSNNSATHTLTNVAGCDSIITLNLTIDNKGADSITACDSYAWIDGVTYTESNNSATHVLTNVNGCDSIVTLDLTINNTPSNLVSIEGVTLQAEEDGVNYQWLDCDNENTPIPDETNQSFIATVNGSYAVEVTQNGCTAVSDCINISTVRIADLTNEQLITLYPNPTNSQVTLTVPIELIGQTIRITNTFGQVINQLVIDQIPLTIDLSNNAKGVYFIETTNKNGSIVKKVVKQ